MKTLKKIAALTLVAGGFAVAGLSNSAEAGGYGYGYAPFYGFSYNYHRPTYYSYPRVNLHCDGFGCHYFIDRFGVRRNCHLAFGNTYYYVNSFGVKTFILGY